MTIKPITKEYLDEVRRRSEAATPGPWIPLVEGRDFPLGGDSFIGRGMDRCEEDLYLTGGTMDGLSEKFPNAEVWTGYVDTYNK